MYVEPYTALRTRVKVIAEVKEYEIEIDRLISKPSEWQEELTVLRIADENDVVRIYLNTEGGYDTTMKAFLSAIADCKARTVGIIVGDCSSAGGPIFLACDEQIVKPLGNLMIHTGSAGSSGTVSNLLQYAKHAELDNNDIVAQCYKDFLTEEEMDYVIKGDELWMREEEICERLAKREEVRNQQAIEEAKETYTPEVYATQCVLDITEDCESFGYNPVEIIKEMLEQAFEAQEESENASDEQQKGVVSEVVEVTWDGTCVYIGAVGYEMNTITHDHLRFVAERLGISFAHNISDARLKQRVLDFLNEED